MTANFPPSLELAEARPNAPLPLGRMLREPGLWWPSDWINVDVLEVAARRGKVSLVADVEIAKDILLNRSGAFSRSRVHDRILAAGYGRNFVPGEKKTVRAKRRHLAQPMTFNRALSQVPRLRKACQALCTDWRNADPECAVDLIRDTRRLTLDALYRGLLVGEDEWQRRDPMVDAVACSMADHASPLTGSADLQADLLELAPLAEHILANPGSYAGSLPGEKNTLLFFLYAGHHNSAATLSWCLWLLAHRPDLQAAIRTEAHAGKTGQFAFETFPLAHATVQETLRLFPPNIQLFREAEESVDVGGHHFDAGTTIVIAIYAIHRHPDIWGDPDAFRPNRFLEPEADQHSQFSLIPFGIAGNACIGANLARIQLTLFISMICERFELLPNPQCPLQCGVDWSLKPVGNAPIFARSIA